MFMRHENGCTVCMDANFSEAAQKGPERTSVSPVSWPVMSSDGLIANSRPSLVLSFVSCLTNMYLMEVCHIINCSVINAVVKF